MRRHRLRSLRAIGVTVAVVIGVALLATLLLAVHPVERTTDCVGAPGEAEVCETTTLSADWVGAAVLGALLAGSLGALKAKGFLSKDDAEPRQPHESRSVRSPKERQGRVTETWHDRWRNNAV
jgi:hypothetical protein